MTSRWRTTYRFEPELPFAGGPIEYPHLGLTLKVNSGILQALEHTFELPDTPERAQAQEHSRERLDTLLAAIRYFRLQPVPTRIDTQRLEPPEGFRLIVHGTGTAGPKPLTTPPLDWDSDAPWQLATWLWLAAEAQESPTPAGAIRFYYFIIEDLRELQLVTATGPVDLDDLKAIRDFVSHPSITVPKTVARLTACAPSLASSQGGFRYLPSNPTQRLVLDDWRHKAGELVDTVLSRWIQG